MRRFVLGLAGAAVIAACSSGGSDGPPPPPPGAIQLFNDSSYDIDEVYVAPSPAPPWGGNRTASVMPPTYSLTIGGLAPGYWDLMAVSWDDPATYYAYALDQLVVSGETLDLSATNSNFTGSLEVTNGNTIWWLTELYIVPTGEAWGSNYLAGIPLDYGEFYVRDNLAPGYYYDVKCVREDSALSTGTYLISPHSLTSISCN